MTKFFYNFKNFGEFGYFENYVTFQESQKFETRFCVFLIKSAKTVIKLIFKHDVIFGRFLHKKNFIILFFKKISFFSLKKKSLHKISQPQKSNSLLLKQNHRHSFSRILSLIHFTLTFFINNFVISRLVCVLHWVL